MSSTESKINISGGEADMNGYISSLEASNKFGITNDYVARLCRQGKVKGKRIERAWFVHVPSLATFLNSVRAKQESKKQHLSKIRREEYLANQEFVSSVEAARRFEVTSDYIARLCRAGKVRGRRIGKRWYVDREALSSFLLNQKYLKEVRRDELARDRTDEYSTLAKILATNVSSFPTGVLHAAASATSHLPTKASIAAHVLSPASDILHKLIGLTVGISLTLGTYAIVNPQAAVFAMDTLRNVGMAIHSGYASLWNGEAELFFARARIQLASAILSTSSMSNNGPQARGSSVVGLFENLARSFNETVDGYIYSLTFPDSLVFGSLSGDRTLGGSVVARVSSRPAPQNTEAPRKTEAIASRGNAPVTVINQPVVERVVETERLVTIGGITEEILNARIKQLDESLSGRMHVLTSANSTSITNVYQTLGAVARSDNFDDINIDDSDITDSRWSGGTISGASISGGSVTASSLTGIVGITNGGTGTSTAPSYGQLLLGQSDGSYTLVATSSLGITVDGGSDFAWTPTTYDGRTVNATSTSLWLTGSPLSLIASSTFATNATTTNATSTSIFASNAIFSNMTTYGVLTAPYFTATSTTLASTFPYASTTALTVSGTASSTSLIVSGLNSTDCDVKASTSGVLSCGTDGNTFPFTATTFGSTIANSTTTLIGFTNGIYSLASSTIGAGGAQTGLTIYGGATTTGNAYFGGNINVASAIGTATSTIAHALAIGGGGIPTWASNRTAIFAVGTTSIPFLRVDSDGGTVLQRGGSSAQSSLGYMFRLVSKDGDDDIFNFLYEYDDTAGGTLGFNKSRGSGTDLSAGDNLGVIDFLGVTAGGSNLRAAQILAEADTGWGGTGDTPGRLSFWTTPDGSTTAVERLRITNAGLIGIGTSSPYAKLSVVGEIAAANFTATTTATSTFPNLLATNATTTSLYVASLSGPLQAINGQVSATSTLSIAYGGTGLSTAPSYGQLLLGNALSGYALTATSSLGLLGSNFIDWQITNGALTPTTTLGIGVYASSTIGNGISGLTVSGAATTTGRAYFSGNVGIGTTTPGSPLVVASDQNTATFSYTTNFSNGAQASANFVTLNDAGNLAEIGIYSSGHVAVGALAAGDAYLYTTSPGLNVMSNNASGVIKFSSGGTAERARFDSSGNFGIGTTTPFAKLSVHAIAGSTNDTLFAVASSTATATSTHFLVTNTGMVSIATTTTVKSGSMSYRLSMDTNNYGGLAIMNGSTTVPLTASGQTAANYINNFNNFAGLYLRKSSTGTGDYLVAEDASNNTQFIVKTSGNVGIGTTSPWGKLSITQTGTDGAPSFIVEDAASPDSTPFVIDQAGLVGIGTSTPSNMLTLVNPNNAGSILAVTTPGTQALQQASINFTTLADGASLGSASNLGWHITGRGNAYTTASQQNDFHLYYWDGSAYNLSLMVDSLSRSVGIGGTTSPAGLFSIEQGTEAASLWIGNTGSSTASLVVEGVNGNGRVGIGTSTPAAALEVISSSGLGGILSTVYGATNFNTFGGRQANGTMGAPSASTAGNLLTFLGGRGYGTTGFSTSSVVGIGGYAEDTFTDASNPTYLALFTTGSGSYSRSERMRITSAGKVGMGTTTPSDLLDIYGNTTAGDIFIGNLFNSGYNSIYLNGLSGNNYNIVSSYSDQNLYLNRPTGSAIYFRQNNTTEVAIDSTGELSVGAATTDANWFSVFDSGATDNCVNVCDVLIANTALAAVENILTMTTEDAAAANEYFMRFVSDEDGTPDNEFLFTTTGAMLSDTAASTPADYAEWTRVMGTTTDYVAGDIVSFSSVDRKAKKAEQGENILGAVTLKPGLVGVSYDMSHDVTDFGYGIGSQAEMESTYGAKIVAQIGYTPLHVSTENGPIANGDPITISSISGVGMKARAGDQIVGHAFEAFDPAAGRLGTHDVELPTIDDSVEFIPTVSSTTTPAGMQVSVGYVFAKVQVGTVPIGRDLVIEDLTSFASSSSSPVLAQDSFMSGFLANLFSRMTAWLGDAGNGIGNLFAQTIHAENVYADTVTANKLCLEDVCVTKEQLQALLTNQNAPTTPVAPAPESATDKPPVITIIGDNPTHIEIGTNYADQGALVSDDKDSNPGIVTFVNGVEMQTIHLNTATTTTYEIKYRSVDSNDNASEAMRTVIVEAAVDEAPASEEVVVAPDPEPSPEPESTVEATSTPESATELDSEPESTTVENAPQPTE